MIPSKGYYYLASPYSHPDPFIRELRYLWTMQELAALLKSGLYFYSPIVHCHELAKVANLPREADFWTPYNYTMLEAAEQFWILMLPGWRESKGLSGETDKANALGLPIIQFEPETYYVQETRHPQRS
jgi:hypothetical protein